MTKARNKPEIKQNMSFFIIIIQQFFLVYVICQKNAVLYKVNTNELATVMHKFHHYRNLN